MFIKGSDNVDPPFSTLANVDAKENERPNKKMKADKSREVEEVKMELYKEAIKCLKSPVPVMEQENHKDSTSLFVKSLESTLRRFSPRHLAIAKKRINDIIFDLEMECYAPQSISTTPPPSSSQPTGLVDRYNLQATAATFNTDNFNWTY